MNSSNTCKKGVLYVVACGAGPAYQLQELVVLAHAAQWDVCVIATPMAMRFVDVPLLAQLTGHSIRSDYKQSETVDVLPSYDAIVVVPATFNTTNKLALGIADTLAASIVCEAIGRGRPVLVVPCVNKDHYARHPAFLRSVSLLKEYGVHVLFDLEKYPPRNEVPWNVILNTLHEAIENTEM